MQDSKNLHKTHTHTQPKSTKYNFVCCELGFLESIAVPDKSEIRFKTMYNKPHNNVDQLKVWSSTYKAFDNFWLVTNTTASSQ